MYEEEFVPQCKKCLRHVAIIKVVEIDSKTKKKWLIDTCPKCDYKSGLEEYSAKTPRKKNPGSTNLGNVGKKWPDLDDGQLDVP